MLTLGEITMYTVVFFYTRSLIVTNLQNYQQTLQFPSALQGNLASFSSLFWFYSQI